MENSTNRIEVYHLLPNLRDYQSVAGSFTWQQAGSLLDGLPGGNGLNIAYEAVERHAKGRSKDTVDSFDALQFVAPDLHFGVETPDARYGK